MFAVIRETAYAPGPPGYQTPQFAQFQDAHAQLPVYAGTVVVDAGAGRLLTLTLWESEAQMHQARAAMEPVVRRTIAPLLAGPAQLVATGPVVVNDLTGDPKRHGSRASIR